MLLFRNEIRNVSQIEKNLFTSMKRAVRLLFDAINKNTNYL